MDTKIENQIKRIALVEALLKLREAQLDGMIVPDIAFEIITNLKDSYGE